MGQLRRAGFWAILPALALQACSTGAGIPLSPVTVGPIAQPIPVRLAVEEEERPFVDHERPEWGLALSGGGLRSAMFSLGVVKALYDSRILDRVDMISTVSGGGYTALWLYSRHFGGQDGSGRFASSTFDPDLFDDQVCHFMGHGNFVPYSRLVRLLRPRFGSADLYEQALARTFGAAGNPAIADLGAKLLETQAPFLIQNASVVADGRDWHTRLLEMTPLSYGNAQYRSAWPDGAPGRLGIITTTAMSVAAVSPLNRHVALRDPGSMPAGHDGLTATDGGKTENLGAFALIRRGVRNVIIADAEHDPGYIFDAYRTLRAGLAAHGLRLRVEDIEDHLLYQGNAPFGHWLSRGSVIDTRTEELVSTVWYLKASLTGEGLDQLLLREGPYTPGLAEDERLEQAIRLSRVDGDPVCADVRLRQPLAMPAWSTYVVASYADYLRRNSKAHLVRQTGIAKAVIDFTQYSTGDQSFYTDQTRAFIGLGYLQAAEFVRGQSAQ